MPRRQTERRLTAILAADAVGYARLVARDEAGALAAVDSAIREALTPCVAAHAGRIVKTMGDGVLATFPSAIEALNAALEFQAAMGARKDAKLRFRVGLGWDQTPVPRTTLSPLLPDTQRVLVAGGLAYYHKWFSLQLSYLAAILLESTSENPDFTATYSTVGHVISAGATLRFGTVGSGYLGPSVDPARKHGTVMWRVEGGEGQFAGASGLITSNFFVADDLAVTDHHFGVIFVRQADESTTGTEREPRP